MDKVEVKVKDDMVGIKIPGLREPDGFRWLSLEQLLVFQGELARAIGKAWTYHEEKKAEEVVSDAGMGRAE